MFFVYVPLPIIYEMRALPNNRSVWKNAGWSQNDMDDLHGKAHTTSVQCEGGYTVDNKAFDKDGTLIKEFTTQQKSVRSAFFDAVKGNGATPYYDIAEAHVSTGLVHLGNISHRLGKAAPPDEIRERTGANAAFQKTWQRMLAHLDANEIDIQKTPPTLGPFLQFDPASERFTGEFADDANRHLKREYRKGFEVPETV
jgi:hypothetical protein